MQDQVVRKDLFRLAVLVFLIAGIVTAVKIVDDKTQAVGRFGKSIFAKVVGS